ncbi:glycosyltransferase [bacterium]|nr:glycosyltransferase [bacterium]
MRLNQHITFLGQQTNVSMLLLNSDLFVLPSLSEGLPTVILEAIACGIPVIASRLPGVMEIIVDKESGWLVEPGNVAEFTKAISRAMVSEDELNRVRMAAFQNLEKFNMEVIANEYLHVYQSLMLH